MYRLRNIRKERDSFLMHIDAFDIQKGQLVCMVGPNGSGKTTLLELLAFQAFPFQGKLFFQDKIVDYKNRTQLLNQRRSIGYLPQNPYLFSVGVFENVAYGLRIRRIPERVIREKTQRILERFSLEHLAERKANSISSGERQRVALARTLIIDTPVYLLDEPTSNIDQEHLKTIETEILRVHREMRSTIIMTTHSREQAYRMSNHILSMIQGKIRNMPYENVFSGILRKEDDLMALPLMESLSIRTGFTNAGNITVVIDPSDIIVSKTPIQSSALNSFQGTIRRLESHNGSLRVFIDVGIDFCALITQHSFHKMKLNIGSQVWVTFKANSVKQISSH